MNCREHERTVRYCGIFSREEAAFPYFRARSLLKLRRTVHICEVWMGFFYKLLPDCCNISRCETIVKMSDSNRTRNMMKANTQRAQAEQEMALLYRTYVPGLFPSVRMRIIPGRSEEGETRGFLPMQACWSPPARSTVRKKCFYVVQQ